MSTVRPLEMLDSESSDRTYPMHFTMKPFDIHPEWFQIGAYVSFWLMVFVVFFISTYAITLPVHSHTEIYFGYFALCTLFDYGAARTTGFIIFQFTVVFLALYFLAMFLRANWAYQQGLAPKWFKNFATVNVIVKLLLGLNVSLVFVLRAEDNVTAHTVGYLFLILCLQLKVIENYLLYNYTNEHIGSKGLPEFWVISSTLVCLAKFSYLVSMMSIDRNSPWIQSNSNYYLAKTIDFLWMLYNAILPVPLSYKIAQQSKFRMYLGGGDKVL